MNAKELIQLNNKKRKELTKENEEYYDNMLVYIRTSVSVSEQQAEELLMELLDHLIDAQAEGKRAEEVFGENLKTYCDEMIKQLPKEPLKSTAFFISFLLLQLASLMAIVSGIGNIVVHYVKDSSQTVYIGTAIVTFVIVAAIISLDVFLLLKWIQKSVYKISNKIKDFFLLFVLIFISLAGMFFLPKLIPPFGYVIEVGGFLYLATGAVTLIVLRWLNSKYQITK
jgi:DNA-binding ferritin-like protein (Dps family)